MRAACDFGADAVYACQQRHSLRARNNEFRMEQIAQGIEEAHARGKRFLVTSDLIAHNDKLRTHLRDLRPVVELKPDALVMADAGLMERRPAQDDQNHISGHSESHRSQSVGEVLQLRADGWAEVEAKNRFAVGDRLEIMHPGGNRVLQLDAMRDQDGTATEVAQGSPIRVCVPLGAPTEGAPIARLL